MRCYWMRGLKWTCASSALLLWVWASLRSQDGEERQMEQSRVALVAPGKAGLDQWTVS